MKIMARGVLFAGIGVIALCAAVPNARSEESADASLALLKKQIALQQQLIEAQQRQLTEQKRAIDRLSAKIEGKTRTSRVSEPSEVAGATNEVEPTKQGRRRTPPPPDPARLAGGPDRKPGGFVVLDNDAFTLTLGGNVKTVAYASPVRPYVAGAPFFLAPRDVTGRENVFRLSAQYSALTASLTGPLVGSFQSGAFFGATLTGGNLMSDTYGITPFNAYAYLRNADWLFSAGLQMDVFSPRIPGMIDQVSALAMSGNPGNTYRAQARVERYVDLGPAGKITLAAAATEPISTTLSGNLLTRTENNGKPSAEGRLSWAFGPPDASTLLKWPIFEAGISGVYGESRTFTGGLGSGAPLAVKTTPTWGVAADAGVRIGERFGVQGEVYTGQALGNYAATLGQTFNPTTLKSLRSRGGWGEAVFYWLPNVQSHAGYGLETITNWNALDLGQLKRNRTAFANVIWNVTDWWRLGLEGTWRWTNYAPSLLFLYAYNRGPGVMASSELRF